jgi:hypothetical protein
MGECRAEIVAMMRAAPPPCPQILGTVAARRSSELCGWRATLRARFG